MTSVTETRTRPPDERIAWVQSLPYLMWHLLPLTCIFIGDVSWFDWAFCGFFYVIRMFGVTAGYHRYFAHRTYKMGRVAQFFMALLGVLAIQKGPLWWAAHHRHHHKHSDDGLDIHSPRQKGLWWAHTGWILCSKYNETDYERIKDFAKYPELVWLNKYWHVIPIAVGVIMFLVGGWGFVMIGGFLSTVFLWHGTYTINSLAHVWGKRRFQTTDDSKNSFVLALLTLGEGWHNNHHYYQGSANQGFYWWEVDISYYAIKLMELVGIVWDVRRPPPRVYAAANADAEPLPIDAEPARHAA